MPSKYQIYIINVRMENATVNAKTVASVSKFRALEMDQLTNLSHCVSAMRSLLYSHMRLFCIDLTGIKYTRICLGFITLKLLKYFLLEATQMLCCW